MYLLFALELIVGLIVQEMHCVNVAGLPIGFRPDFLAHLGYIPMTLYNNDSWLYGMWSWLWWCVWHMCMLLLYWLHELHILQVYHIMPPIDAHEIFSQYHVYFSTRSHFAKIIKITLLSISLNLEAQYCTRSWIQSGAIYSQEIVDLVYIGLKL